MKNIKRMGVVMMVTEKKQLGLPMLCVKECSGGSVGYLGLCYDLDVFNINGVKYWEPQHVHFYSSRTKIIDGDWCLMFDDLGNLFCDRPQQYLPKEGHVLNKNLRKIEASTDTKLRHLMGVSEGGCASIPVEFVVDFVLNKGHAKFVNIEMRQTCVQTGVDCGIPCGGGCEYNTVKIMPNNDVIIHPDKFYSQEEVDFLLKDRTEQLRKAGLSYGATESLNNWIKENIEEHERNI